MSSMMSSMMSSISMTSMMSSSILHGKIQLKHHTLDTCSRLCEHGDTSGFKHLETCRSFQLIVVIGLQPGMSDDLSSGDPLLGVLHQQLRDQVLGLDRDGGPLGLGKLKITILDIVKEIPLTFITKSSFVPSTFSSTISTERRISTQKDVHHNSQAPEVASFVVHQFLISVFDESLDNLWSHKFC